MNRSRKVKGVNSYERELNFDVLNFLNNKIDTQNKVLWLDACCGEGNAMIQTAIELKGFGEVRAQKKMTLNITKSGSDGLTANFAAIEVINKIEK